MWHSTVDIDDSRRPETEGEVQSHRIAQSIGDAIRRHMEQADEAEQRRCIQALEQSVEKREQDKRREQAARAARGDAALSTFRSALVPDQPAALDSCNTKQQAVTTPAGMD